MSGPAICLLMLIFVHLRVGLPADRTRWNSSVSDSAGAVSLHCSLAFLSTGNWPRVDGRTWVIKKGHNSVIRQVLGLCFVALIAGCTTSTRGDHLLEEAVYITRQGSFEAGGRIVGESDASSLACDHGHVEYQIPVKARKTALFLWHSSSVAVWQRSWDGGEGFQTKILRRGYPTFLWDGPRVGRGSWSCEAYEYKPVIGRDQRNFGAWRLGPKFGEFHPGIQFPTDNPKALEQANRARYLEFDTVKNAQLETDAAAAAIDRIGPSVLLTSSAGGFRAILTRLKSENVHGIVAYENPGYVFPESMEPKLPEGPFGPVYVSDEDFKRLTQIPIQLVWGDYINGPHSNGWDDFQALGQLFVEVVNARGGKAEMLKLTEAGLKGNTHIPFADLNNEEVAHLLFRWLEANGFE